MKPFISSSFQKQKPFSGFLPGIAGLEGLPMWVFYVNRGQAISSFGVRDKNGAITEFYPANLAYAYVHQHGFRTFIKWKNEVYECFKESETHQQLHIEGHQIVIEETIDAWNILVRVTYATLPNMPLSALMRKVEIVNLDQQPKELIVVDGLSQMLPAGIDYGGYKAISNLLQSWMEVEEASNHVFLKLRASTADSSEVKAVEEGNFYTYFGLSNYRYIYDYKAIFNQDSSFQTPYQVKNLSYVQLINQKQAPVNQVPSGFVATQVTLTTTQRMIGVFGYSKQRSTLESLLQTITVDTLENKFIENANVIETLIHDIKTETAFPMFDDYLQQCYLDNILRGGYPLKVETLDGPIAYHIYSRKHGDLERDYNFFSLEPSYLSQGNGAFRDVLQNRRNDVYFHPDTASTTIAQFASLIQADGYNPLSIEGIQFTFHGDFTSIPSSLHTLLKSEFTPGQVANAAGHQGLPVMKTVQDVLGQSRYQFKATYGEGYWGDHFTYFLDLIESYDDVFPDLLPSLLQQEFPYFISPARVLKRSEKYVLKNGKVRQYHAVHHDHQRPVRGWLIDAHQKEIRTTLMAKLITLVTNKFALLDPEELGLMYEADRPGWNDAMNGLPGLFGSGVSEMFELKRLVDFVRKQTINSIQVLAPLVPLIQSLIKMNSPSLIQRWDQRMTALEQYRDALNQPINLAFLSAETVKGFLDFVQDKLNESINRVLKISDVPYTYFWYEASEFEPLGQTQQEPHFVNVKQFKRHNIPHFLEAPARLASSQLISAAEAKALYQKIKQTDLYDKKLKIYKTSVSLDDESMEIGRIRAFTPGWLERESAFLHMTYKYMLGLLKAEAYDAFFETMKDGLTCFMDPLVYGRSPLENSSFIATTNNPDASKHGQGFFARLSGSTAEVLSMWKRLILGSHLFTMNQGQLQFQIAPLIPSSFFKEGKINTMLFSTVVIQLKLISESVNDTNRLSVIGYELYTDTHAKPQLIQNAVIRGETALAIRKGQFKLLKVLLKGGP